MNNRFCILTIGLIIMVAVLPVQGRHPGRANRAEINTVLDFNKEPVRFMAEIYKCYHNWKLDRGIKLSIEALVKINVLYTKDPNAVIKDPKLKLNKAYQTKSTLHTLAGMLYYRKSLESLRRTGEKEHAFILEKLKKDQEITEKDFEKLSQKVKQNETPAKDNNFLLLAKEQFVTAIDTDPANPAPHFQLAGVYRAMGDPKSLKTAEKHCYNAARLAVKEGDNKALDRALELLMSLNPGSPYIKKLESLKKR